MEDCVGYIGPEEWSLWRDGRVGPSLVQWLFTLLSILCQSTNWFVLSSQNHRPWGMAGHHPTKRWEAVYHSVKLIQRSEFLASRVRRKQLLHLPHRPELGHEGRGYIWLGEDKRYYVQSGHAGHHSKVSRRCVRPRKFSKRQGAVHAAGSVLQCCSGAPVTRQELRDTMQQLTGWSQSSSVCTRDTAAETPELCGLVQMLLYIDTILGILGNLLMPKLPILKFQMFLNICAVYIIVTNKKVHAKDLK